MFLCDLGIAKLYKAAEVTCTHTGKGPGTVPYMAPEMFQKAQRGRAVDIYSLGCLLIELFGRCRVWPGLTAMEIMGKVCGAFGQQPQMPCVTHLPSHLQEICKECCQYDSTKRPNISAVVEMLSEIIP